MHGSKWSKVAAKILTMLLFSKENKSPSIVIIHNDWKKYVHTQKLKEVLEKSKCFMIYSNFQNRWEKKISKKIENVLGEEKCYVSVSNQRPIPFRLQLFPTKEEHAISLPMKSIQL